MRYRSKFLVVTLVLALVSNALGQQAPPPAAEPANPQEAVQPQQQPPVQSPATAPLSVMVGKSILINTAERLRRVSVTDPNIADALVVTPNQVLVHGKAPGEVSLILWDEQERSRTFDLRVEIDISTAAQEIRRLFPSENIEVSASRNAMVLSGHVTSERTAQRAGQVASSYAQNVINVLTFGPVGSQEVLLEVKFAEVDRTALTQIGANLFSTGAANTFGSSSTQQFPNFSGSNIGSIPANVQSTGAVNGNNVTAGAIGNPLSGQPAVFGSTDLLNLFLFRSDVNLGVIIKALQQKNVLQILAEPNLIAGNGKEASFLAGGEFPFPVVQQGAFQTVTIQFREFGVRLRFTPEITPNGNIHLKVAPEVSSLDFTNALTISGFLIPALSTRRAETEFDLQDGQSFVIAGLMDNRLASVVSKLPGLGDIPILGYLFKSKSLQKSKSELMVMVTVRRVSPSTAPSPGPQMPQPFLDDQKFDGSKPGGMQ